MYEQGDAGELCTYYLPTFVEPCQSARLSSVYPYLKASAGVE